MVGHREAVSSVRKWATSKWIEALRVVFLPTWFAAISGYWLYLNFRAGISLHDTQYLEATRRWLSGVDPWATAYPGWFAAPPISLVPLVPFAVIPYGDWLLIACGLAAAVATLRRLGRPLYWLLFPPLFIGLFGGGADVWLPLLILSGLGPVAVLGKVYALVPMVILGRWRAVIGAAALVALTWPVLPWGSYIAQFTTIQGHLAEQAAGLSAPLVAVPVVVVSLVVMGRQRAAWMTVPALWPSTQFYYGTLALPALTLPAAAIMAIPSPWAVVGACVVLAATSVLRVPDPSY
ncbi:MAG: hypothetical protein ABIR11_07175 [Candidatus Limnocylindrales bacterium]